MQALIIILVIVVLGGVFMYNSLVRKKVNAEEAWSGIEVQMKRRYDLIPNLVNTVKGYAAHEEKVFMQVTEARTSAMSVPAGSAMAAQHAQNEGALSMALKSLFAVAEAYPELKADQNFAKLQDELTDTEDKMMAARRFYNGAVNALNTALEVFPSNIFGRIFGFVKREFFELSDAERAAAEVAPKVSF